MQEVPINTPTVIITSLANQTTFIFPFFIIEHSHLEVYVGSTRNTVTVNYIVSTNQNNVGGTVTFTSPIAEGTIVTLVRNTTRTRTYTYYNFVNPTRNADLLNEDFNRIILQIQELHELYTNCVKVGILDPASSTALTLPDTTTMDGKWLEYSGGAIIGTTPSQVARDGEWNSVLNKPIFNDVALSGDYNHLSNRPILATIASTGSLADAVDYDTLVNDAGSLASIDWEAVQNRPNWEGLLDIEGNWDASLPYSTGQKVLHNNTIYTRIDAITPTINDNAPDTDTSKWASFKSLANLIPKNAIEWAKFSNITPATLGNRVFFSEYNNLLANGILQGYDNNSIIFQNVIRNSTGGAILRDVILRIERSTKALVSLGYITSNHYQVKSETGTTGMSILRNTADDGISFKVSDASGTPEEDEIMSISDTGNVNTKHIATETLDATGDITTTTRVRGEEVVCSKVESKLLNAKHASTSTLVTTFRRNHTDDGTLITKTHTDGTNGDPLIEIDDSTKAVTMHGTVTVGNSKVSSSNVESNQLLLKSGSIIEGGMSTGSTLIALWKASSAGAWLKNLIHIYYGASDSNEIAGRDGHINIFGNVQFWNTNHCWSFVNPSKIIECYNNKGTERQFYMGVPDGHLRIVNHNTAGVAQFQAGTNGQAYLQCNPNGTIYSKLGSYVASDKRFKEDIKDIPVELLDKISEVEFKSFTWSDFSKTDLGVIAQEVKKHLPDVVSSTEISENFGNFSTPIKENYEDETKFIQIIKDVEIKKKQAKKECDVRVKELVKRGYKTSEINVKSRDEYPELASEYVIYYNKLHVDYTKLLLLKAISSDDLRECYNVCGKEFRVEDILQVYENNNKYEVQLKDETSTNPENGEEITYKGDYVTSIEKNGKSPHIRVLAWVKQDHNKILPREKTLEEITQEKITQIKEYFKGNITEFFVHFNKDQKINIKANNYWLEFFNNKYFECDLEESEFSIYKDLDTKKEYKLFKKCLKILRAKIAKYRSHFAIKRIEALTELKTITDIEKVASLKYKSYEIIQDFYFKT